MRIGNVRPSPRLSEASPEALLSAIASENQHYDYFELALKNKAGRRRSALAVFREALATVWAAARWPFVAVTLLTVSNALLATAQILVTQRLLASLLAHPRHVVLSQVFVEVLVLAILGALTLGASAATTQVQRLLGQLTGQHVMRQMLDVTTGVPLDAYETPWFFNYVIRIETNAVTKPLEITQSLVAIFAGAFTAVGVGIVIIGIEPLLIPLLFLAVLPTYVGNRLASRWDFNLAVEQAPTIRLQLYYAMILKLRDTAKEVRAFALADVLLRRWESLRSSIVGGIKRVVVRRVKLSLGTSLLSGAITAGTLMFLLWRVADGAVALSEAGAALVALRLLTTRLQSTSAGANSLFECRLFLDDLSAFLALKDALDVPSRRRVSEDVPVPIPDRLTDIVVDGVKFTYPGSKRPALNGIDIEIRAGEIVALVGENGSGKTTLAKLLAGLHYPTSGEVRWSGIPTTALDIQELRQQIAVIFQDFARYELSALENISIGRAHDDLDVAAVKAAARHAGADGFLKRLPNGYDTLLSKSLPGGTDLSIGQWQRVALARAFYRDAPFVVLDEPTSALDPMAEQDLFDRIRTLLADRTVLLISHRFSSVRSADRIYVLSQGRVAETGTHLELMAMRGRYHEMFTLQASAYLEDA